MATAASIAENRSMPHCKGNDGKCPCEITRNEEFFEIKADDKGKPRRFCSECDHQLLFHPAAPSTASSSSSSNTESRKRKSLPAPASGGKWTSAYLKSWNIGFVDVSDLSSFLCAPSLLAISDRSQALINECKQIDANVIIDPSVFPAGLSEAAHHLVKLLHLVAGTPRAHLESFVDDFVIALLGYLGFNCGDLIVTSKNELKLKMQPGGKGRECATADVTVFHIGTMLRLAVWEDKAETQIVTAKSIDDTEAQGVAEVIAACQWNQDNLRAIRPRSAGDNNAPRLAAAAASEIFQLFLIRVRGDSFVFYHANSIRGSLLDAIENHQHHEQPTSILRFRPVKAAASSSASSLPSLTTSHAQPATVNADDAMAVELSRALEIVLRFRVPNERQIIIQVLDAIRQMFLLRIRSS